MVIMAHSRHSEFKSEFLGHFFCAGRGRFGDGVVHLVVLDHLLRATAKKGRQLFFRKKCTPRQNACYAYACELKLTSAHLFVLPIIVS